MPRWVGQAGTVGGAAVLWYAVALLWLGLPLWVVIVVNVPLVVAVVGVVTGRASAPESAPYDWSG